jgi:uncharacterized protein (TIRG00374 family)
MSAELERKPRKINWGLWLRLIVTAGILCWLGSHINWHSFLHEIEKAKCAYLFFTTAAIGIMLFLISIRLWILLRIQDIRLPLKTVTALTFIGHFFNCFLIGATGGDLVKLVYLVQCAPTHKARAGMAVFIDRIVGVIALLLLGVAVLPHQWHTLSKSPETKAVEWGIVSLFIVCSLTLIAIIVLPIQSWLKRWHDRLSKIPKWDMIESIISGLNQYAHKPRLFAAAFAFAIIAHTMDFMCGYFLAQSIGLDVNFIEMLIVMIVVICVICLPVSINGTGVRELTFVQMFSLYGIIHVDPITHAGQEPAIAVSVLLYILTIFWGLVGGIVYLFYNHNNKKILQT